MNHSQGSLKGGVKMCDPVSMTVASTAMQIYSGNQTAKATANAAEQNAALARGQASAVEDKKARELTQINQQRAQTLGSQRAVMAANGVDSGTGSGLEALSNTYYLAQQDANNTEMNAANEKYAYNQQAANYENEASAARAAGRNNMIGSLISGVASVSALKAGSAVSKAGIIGTSSSNKLFSSYGMSKYGTVAKKWF